MYKMKLESCMSSPCPSTCTAHNLLNALFRIKAVSSKVIREESIKVLEDLRSEYGHMIQKFSLQRSPRAGELSQVIS